MAQVALDKIIPSLRNKPHMSMQPHPLENASEYPSWFVKLKAHPLSFLTLSFQVQP